MGNYVDIFDGTGTWRYGHLQAYYVKNGEYIAEGQVFASVGSTGKRSLGSHLHIEYRVDGIKTFFTDRFGVKFKIVEGKRQK
jgi:murein DD-endopeptidase MepM/ murein hydrolase activator NlpD